MIPPPRNNWTAMSKFNTADQKTSKQFSSVYHQYIVLTQCHWIYLLFLNIVRFVHWDSGLNTVSMLINSAIFCTPVDFLTNFNQISDPITVQKWILLNDIRLNTDSSKVPVSVLLDLSAGFDTVDHSTADYDLTGNFGRTKKNSPTIVPVLLGIILWPLEFISLIEWLWQTEHLKGQVLNPFYSVYICCLWVIFCRTLMLAIIFMQMTHRRLQSKRDCVTV